MTATVPPAQLNADKALIIQTCMWVQAAKAADTVARSGCFDL
jgi:hypothetical protein